MEVRERGRLRGIGARKEGGKEKRREEGGREGEKVREVLLYFNVYAVFSSPTQTNRMGSD